MAKIKLDNISYLKENLDTTNITFSKERLLGDLKIMKMMINGDFELASTTSEELLKIIRKIDLKDENTCKILWDAYDDLRNSISSTKDALTKLNNLSSNLEG